MKSLSILLGIFLTLILLGCKNNSSPKSYFQVNDSWNLIFEDNFDNDLSLWNPWYGGAFNNEIQLYKPEQVSLSNGILTIAAQRESISGPTTPFDTSKKTSNMFQEELKVSNCSDPLMKMEILNIDLWLA